MAECQTKFLLGIKVIKLMFRLPKITRFLTVSDLILIGTLLIAGLLSLALVGGIGDRNSYTLVEVGGTVTQKLLISLENLFNPSS